MFEFDFILGGVVTLECCVGMSFGEVVPDSLRVTFNGKAFDCGGVIVDYDGEFLPVKEYLIAFAKQEIRRDKLTSKENHGYATVT